MFRRARENSSDDEDAAAIPNNATIANGAANEAADDNNVAVRIDIFDVTREEIVGGEIPANVVADNVAIANIAADNNVVINLIIDIDVTIDVADPCSICLDVPTNPVDISSCTHKFCTTCIRAWIRSRDAAGYRIVCPLCRTTIPRSVRRNIMAD